MQSPNVGLHSRSSRICLALAFAFSVSACSSADQPSGTPQPEAGADPVLLKVGFEQFADTEIALALAEVVLGSRGYELEWTTLDIGLIYEALASGNLDAYPNAWYPAGHVDYWEVYEDRLQRLGPLHEEATYGVCVGDDSPATSWEDMADPEIAALFDNQVIGHFEGSATMLLTQNAIDAYGADLRLTASSVAAMLATVDPKISAGSPVAWVCWKPDSWWARWNMQFLEDPRGAFPVPDGAFTAVRRGFESEPGMATAHCYFTNVRISAEEQSEMIFAAEQPERTAIEVAREWVGQNDTRVESWFENCP